MSSDPCNFGELEKFKEIFDVVLFVHGVAVGLALTRAFEFLGRAAANLRDPGKKDERISWYHAFWVFALMTYCAQFWYFMALWKCHVSLNFLEYCVTLAMPMLLYVISTIICPKMEEIGAENPTEYFKRNSWILFGLIGLTLVLSAAEGKFITNRVAYPSENVARVFFGLGFMLLGLYFYWKVRKWLSVLYISVAAVFRLLMVPYPI